jgi:gas vesicle protein
MLDKQRLRTFVLGGIAGALAGILLAPKSGKELRGSITSRAGEARERGRESYFEAQERVQERISEARERPLRRGEARSAETAADSLPRLEPSAPEPELPKSTSAGPPPLRDVSQDVLSEAPAGDMPQPISGEEPDPEEIQRKIQETRSRLRARLDDLEDAPGGRDG